jgi:hypothetical protein
VAGAAGGHTKFSELTAGGGGGGYYGTHSIPTAGAGDVPNVGSFSGYSITVPGAAVLQLPSRSLSGRCPCRLIPPSALGMCRADGGGAGAYVEAVLYKPLAKSYAWDVGAGGEGGDLEGGGVPGGAGGNGFLAIEAFFR